jgi:hypothetical protein
MNDFSELEAELKKLRPAPVSEELEGRIARDLARPEPAPTAGLLPRPRRRIDLWSLGLGLAGLTALVLLGVGRFSQAPAPDAPLVGQENEPGTTESSSLQSDRAFAETELAPSGLQPSRLTRVVYHRRDEGIVFSPNQSERPLRRVRFETRDTMQWRDPQTGASLRVTYPAEQVVLTPVSFQ